ncbi:membrane protein insertase YidC [Clostridium pasteurianum]|uniref:Preprotein translocase subunit YidC n=1 Tax=Clostridium pasteurianum BC1 TaxID=86416 RepID=R4K8T6_CLOPA|nr:membrane protein insertase YidC [Clostridium pasteurianum]AGK99582.1 preprotein translocase subunit YidC [Clostridium pasteurianum BC1]
MFKINFLNDLFVNFFQAINRSILNIIPNNNVSYGLSIIVLTIIIRMILLPLNVKQIKSSLMMSKVGPEVKKLQTKYKSDPQKLQQETMKLYKEKGVNPLGGCLPLLIQYPILIALYYVFSTLAINGIGFLWIHDLSKSATMSDWTSWILPVISGATTYFSGMLMSSTAVDKAQAKQTSTMNIVMSIVLFYMSLRFNAALVLYWVTGNIVQILQTTLVMKMVANKINNEENENKIAAESSVTIDNKDIVKNKRNKKRNSDKINNN